MNRLIAFLIVALPIGGCKSTEVQQWADAVQQASAAAKPVAPPDVAADLDKAAAAAGSLRDATEGQGDLTALELLKAAREASKPFVPEPYGAWADIAIAGLGLAATWWVGRKQGTGVAKSIIKTIEVAKGEDGKIDFNLEATRKLMQTLNTPAAEKLIREETAKK